MKKLYFASMIAAAALVALPVFAQTPAVAAAPAPAVVVEPAPAIPSNAPVLLKLIPEDATAVVFFNGQAIMESPILNSLLTQFLGKDINSLLSERKIEKKNQQGIVVFFIKFKDIETSQFEVGGAFQTMKNNAKDSFAQIVNSAIEEQKKAKLNDVTVEQIKIAGKDALRVKAKEQKLSVLVLLSSEDTIQFRMQSGMDTPIPESLIPFRGDPTALANSLDMKSMLSLGLNMELIKKMTPGAEADPMLQSIKNVSFSIFETKNFLRAVCELINTDAQSAQVLKAQLDPMLDALKQDPAMKDFISLVKSSVDGSKLLVKADIPAAKIQEYIGAAMLGVVSNLGNTDAETENAVKGGKTPAKETAPASK